ncbi:hypothetical protein CRUP_018825 [Coryphaenoides rupestris]|nr:hypothetical protein CRUP_018825 [Coryphaenoides rupestris]
MTRRRRRRGEGEGGETGGLGLQEEAEAVSVEELPGLVLQEVGGGGGGGGEGGGGDPPGVAVGEGFPSREELSGISAACLPLAPGTGQQKKSRRKRGSKKYRSFRKSFRKTSRKDITCVEPIVNVQPTDSYFEKVSEEMELIVHQVKDKDGEKVLTDEEVINRIIALTIKEGDVIDEKGMSYSAFKKLADTYLEDETAPPVQGEAEPSLPRAAAPPTAPELVKLAFTLDFTARVAGLSRLNACTDHPWSDSEDDKKHQD